MDERVAGIFGGICNVNHRAVLTDLSTNSQALYVQLGYRLPWFEHTVKPYYSF